MAFFKRCNASVFSETGYYNAYRVMIVGAIITTLYSVRLYYLAFWQSYRAVSLKPYSKYANTTVDTISFSILAGYWLAPYLTVLQDSLFVTSLTTDQTLNEIMDTGKFINHALS